MNEADVTAVLNKAADKIERYGWGVGDLWLSGAELDGSELIPDDRGRGYFCVTGALSSLLDLSPQFDPMPNELAKEIARRLGCGDDSEEVWDALLCFNDSPDTDPYQVISLLRRPCPSFWEVGNIPTHYRDGE